MPIALDATYSLGSELSGVGLYCREILNGLAAAHPEQRFWFCYRPHRYVRSFRESLPANATRYLLHDRWHVPTRAAVFHGLNQRLPEHCLRRAVCTFHDLFVLTGEYSTSEFRARFSKLARDAAERSDLVIAVSHFTAQQVTNLLGVEASKVRVVHHGVRTRPERRVQRERMVLHVGAIQKRKNIAGLVRAFEAIPGDWRLVLAGSAGYGAEEALHMIDRSPARDRIHVRGYVTPETLADLYSRASIFAFPSLDEGFGMPALEAMAHGVPVLSSRRAAMPEVCGDAALLIDPEAESELSTALSLLMSDEALRQRLSRLGKERAAEFTWNRAVAETYDVYTELGL